MQRYICRVPVRQLSIGTADGTAASLADATVQVRPSSYSPTGAVVELGDGTEIPCVVPAGADLTEGPWELSHLGVITNDNDEPVGLFAAPPDTPEDSDIYERERGDVREVLLLSFADGSKVRDIGWNDVQSQGYFTEVLPNGRVRVDRDVDASEAEALLIVDTGVELRLYADGIDVGTYNDGAYESCADRAIELGIVPFAELIVNQGAAVVRPTTVKLMPGVGEDAEPYLAVADSLTVPVLLPEGLSIPDDGIDCAGVIVVHGDGGRPEGVVPVCIKVPPFAIANGDDEVDQGLERGLALIVRPGSGVEHASFSDENSRGDTYRVNDDGEFFEEFGTDTTTAALLVLDDDSHLDLNADGEAASSVSWEDGVLRIRNATQPSAGSEAAAGDAEAVGEV
ncbi:MAG: hypothetical protein KDD66_00120 [Bdellovibrionales bacterium]|nr:hypothetical protein [Bdellovibrionales bacterium]